MTAWGQATDLALAALAEIGRGIYQAVAEHADWDATPIRKALHRMSREPRAVRRVYIMAWTTGPAEGGRSYPRPVYALGNKDNATKPKPKSHTVSARESARRAQRMLSTVHPTITQKQAVALRGRINREARA